MAIGTGKALESLEILKKTLPNNKRIWLSGDAMSFLKKYKNRMIVAIVAIILVSLLSV